MPQGVVAAWPMVSSLPEPNIWLRAWLMAKLVRQKAKRPPARTGHLGLGQAPTPTTPVLWGLRLAAAQLLVDNRLAEPNILQLVWHMVKLVRQKAKRPCVQMGLLACGLVLTHLTPAL